jgi:hypothetical protein
LRETSCTHDRSVWKAYVGKYDTVSGPLTLYRDSERLVGVGADVPVHPIEFLKQADGSVMLVVGRSLGIKK